MTTSTVTLADFGDPTALDLGEGPEGCGFNTVAGAALRVARIMDETFGGRRVQFWFNGSPAVVSTAVGAPTPFEDWNERRAAWARAASITG